MSLNKKRLNAAKLYLILDAGVMDHAQMLNVLKDTVRAGVDIVQLRDKKSGAKDILSFCRHALKITHQKALFIVNDRVDLAILSGADGVHLGQDDISISDAKRFMKSNAIIGCSCQRFDHAVQAQAMGADYIGFGSVFKTLTKPERSPMDLKVLRKVYSSIQIPVFSIGGISLDNVGQLTPFGVNRVAVCRDILLAKNPAQAVKAFKAVL